MKQIAPDVVAAYPITPQTSLMQKFASFVSDGEVDTEMILVESEHSAMSAAVGSAVSGARTMTATSANGLALMWEIVYIAASSRLPIIMPVVNRALSAPINIHCDHSDAMGARDSGWIQLWSNSLNGHRLTGTSLNRPVTSVNSSALNLCVSPKSNLAMAMTVCRRQRCLFSRRQNDVDRRSQNGLFVG